MKESTATKIVEAKKMVNHFFKTKRNTYFIQGLFTPTEYERMRWGWDGATASWATIKKYADEIGLKSKDFTIEYHNDGSMLSLLAGIPDGEIFHHTGYYFEG